MKQQQNHLLTLTKIRVKQSKGEIYASLYDVLNDLQRNDSEIVGFLDKKIAGGELKSVEDIADWFLARFHDEQKECELLVKQL